MTGVTKAVVCVILSDAYKRTLAANQKRVDYAVEAGFFSCYLSGPLPYV